MLLYELFSVSIYGFSYCFLYSGMIWSKAVDEAFKIVWKRAPFYTSIEKRDFKHLILMLFVNISKNIEKDLVLNLVHGKQADSVVASL